MNGPGDLTPQMLEQMMSEAISDVGKVAQRKVALIVMAKHFRDTTLQTWAASVLSGLHATLALAPILAALSWLAMLLLGDAYNAGLPVPAPLLGYWSNVGVVAALLGLDIIYRIAFRGKPSKEPPIQAIAVTMPMPEGGE